jgi:hypothetical protein
LLFVVGASGGWPKWESFEHLGGMVDRLAALEAQRPEPKRPEPEPEPRPEPGPEPFPQPDHSLARALLDEADRRQVLQFNREAALQKRIFADGFVPNSPEFDLTFEGAQYIGQRAENLDTGEVRVYHVRAGDWGNVAFNQRDETDRAMFV